MIHWEELKADYRTLDGKVYELRPPMRRAKIPGGWLIMAGGNEEIGITFYPDPQHKWDGSSLP